MFNHVVVGSNHLSKAKTFYDAIFAVLGVGAGGADDTATCQRYVYRSEGGSFYITQPIDGRAASAANGGTIGFRCSSSDQVDQWHAAGVTHGGVTAEDPPGHRGPAVGGVYLAYLRDPDGHKLCAVYKA